MDISAAVIGIDRPLHVGHPGGAMDFVCIAWVGQVADQLVGLISMPIFFGLLVLLTLLTGRSSIRFLKRLPLPRPGRLIALFIIVSMTLALALALLPATSWDGLFYHLTGPKLYLEQGRIASGIDIPHLNFPFLFELLYLLSLTFG